MCGALCRVRDPASWHTVDRQHRCCIFGIRRTGCECLTPQRLDCGLLESPSGTLCAFAAAYLL